MPARTAGVRRDCRCKRARHRHGTYGAYYSDNCRCLPCCFAYAISRGHGGDRVLVDGIGVQRRLQALTAIGWSCTRIGAVMGVSQQHVQKLRRGRTPLVHPATVARVAAVYDLLWNETPEITTAQQAGDVTRALQHAASHGWPPPLAWDDDTIDDPNADPSPIAVGPRVTCGTDYGYQVHRDNGEQTCPACRHARHTGNQARDARRAERAA